MIPRNRWYFAAALVALACGIIGMSELFYSRDLSDDWHGPAWILTGLAWLAIAYRGTDGSPSD